MDPNLVPGWLDKYGPMGCALIVVCVVLIVLTWKLIPSLLETYGRRLDTFATALHRLIDVVTSRMDKADMAHQERHEELLNKLDSIDGKIERNAKDKK